ncbi:MAG: phosphoribosylamine--glycine ligase [Candidatus Rokubacteria bacterium 13_1_40CM_69_27]|nr:MAG: phosphoribosylamine--glycine ligase [Candidatus Rokubacteria bacterium 13_1_40CM_69_27]OLE38471.1 MAG: phosphoribosylamine--glycine ligase [Candidatus Rokubacteria bacterium 13_1_20CM_2_70_7]
MKLLLVGGGGREHALAWKIAQSPLVDTLYAAPGNPGIARHARCVPIKAEAHQELLAFAQRERIDFTVVGPEAPLVAGLADRFTARGLGVFGPTAAAAQIEGSKAFAKSLMKRYRIPTARFETFDDVRAAIDHCQGLRQPVVVKVDGLAAGKGVTVCQTAEEAAKATSAAMELRVFGDAGKKVVIEEFLHGEEVSFFALANGETAVPLGAARDHKTVFDDDRGPNTGGMGAYSPVPGFDAAAEQRVMESIVNPTIAALAKDGMPYRGVLFVGLMMTGEGSDPKVLEFNCRFGDPECQALVVRLGSDLVPLLLAAARGDRLPERVAWSPEAAVCVTLASGGYPERYPMGLPIDGIDAAETVEGVRVFHAGTAERDGKLVTAGGRVLSVTATAPRLADAIARAYAAAARIRFDGVHYRTDIGRKGIR